MKYLLLQFGNGTQMAKVLETKGNNLIVVRMNSSLLYWLPKTSKIKATDTRIIKEMTVDETLAYVLGREHNIYRTEKPNRYGIMRFYNPHNGTYQLAAEYNKAAAENFAAVVAGIKADFASVLPTSG